MSKLAGTQGRRALVLASFPLISGAVLALALGAERVFIARTLSLLNYIFAALLLCGETRGGPGKEGFSLPFPGLDLGSSGKP